MKVAILGAGKVGTAFARALGQTRHSVRLVAARRAGRARFDEALLLLAVRDTALSDLAAELAAGARVGAGTAVVHLAGARGPEVLAALAPVCAGVGQAHPMLSFASRRAPPALRGGHLLVSGDALAVQRASTVGRALGLVPRRWRRVDRALYHAAGGLVANGAAALAAAGARLLRQAGAPERDIARVLGPLLASVAHNVEQLGLPGALTGPIRRGDSATVALHLRRIVEQAPEVAPVYRELARLQLELARTLGDASASELDRVARVVSRRQSSRGGKLSRV